MRYARGDELEVVLVEERANVEKEEDLAAAHFIPPVGEAKPLAAAPRQIILAEIIFVE